MQILLEKAIHLFLDKIPFKVLMFQYLFYEFFFLIGL